MNEQAIIAWKSTRADGSPVHGSKSLPLPANGRPGEWHDTGGDPILCERGVHGCRTLLDMLRGGWLNERLWVAELRGPFVEMDDDKIAARSGRLLYSVDTWNDQTARLFAADAAESVNPPNPDPRSLAAIRVVRRYSFGLSNRSDLDAARAAAGNATWAAAWAAAGDATWAAAGVAAGVAARAAARDATWDAARDATWDAARVAHIRKLTLRLGEYLRGEVDLEAIKRGVE